MLKSRNAGAKTAIRRRVVWVMNKPRLLRRSIRALRLAALLALPFAPRPAAADPVTEWTALADQIGGGRTANWHTLAIMHRAMHDAGNAALPIYARWDPPAADEPPGAGAVPQAAMAAAAREVIALLHPARRAEADRLLRDALARLGEGEAREAGVALGRAVGAAAVARRQDDGYERRHFFPSGAAPGQWRAPPNGPGGYTETRPFLFRDLDDAAPRPPPPPGSAAYKAGVEDVWRLGAQAAPGRTRAEAETAVFWAYQLPQRGVVQFAAGLLDEHPRPLGQLETARIMSQVASAMADAAVLAWAEKGRYLLWRPISAIQEGGFGVAADPDWRPLVDTPNHPEYPSGHATDCFTGAALLQAVFGRNLGVVTYAYRPGPALWGDDSVPAITDGMPGPDGQTEGRRRYAGVAAVAEECARSRVWAGVHFPAANEEGRRLGALIAARAEAAVPPLR
jgi:hypothetical protein